MDDARIEQLAQEVLAQLRGAPAAAGDLEARVAGLEAAVRELMAARGVALPAAPPATAARATAVATAAPATAVAVAVAHAHPHPSFGTFGVPSGSDRCVVEPDKPCVRSGQCRALGH